MVHVQSGIRENDEQELKEMMEGVYHEYLKLKEARGVTEESKEEQKQARESDIGNFFFYLEEAEW